MAASVAIPVAGRAADSAVCPIIAPVNHLAIIRSDEGASPRAGGSANLPVVGRAAQRTVVGTVFAAVDSAVRLSAGSLAGSLLFAGRSAGVIAGRRGDLGKFS
jgi:hypothetical protein